ncbi:hypothetical protein D082_33450 [Synechocystis sp. PCC 6714]|nr:hypothetical protein D082_33450 [Synechocystis sp. PCC 6714]
MGIAVTAGDDKTKLLGSEGGRWEKNQLVHGTVLAGPVNK